MESQVLVSVNITRLWFISKGFKVLDKVHVNLFYSYYLFLSQSSIDRISKIRLYPEFDNWYFLSPHTATPVLPSFHLASYKWHFFDEFKTQHKCFYLPIWIRKYHINENIITNVCPTGVWLESVKQSFRFEGGQLDFWQRVVIDKTDTYFTSISWLPKTKT